DPTRLATAGQRRARGDRIVRRRRAVAAVAASTAVLVLAVALVAGGTALRAHPQPVQPPTPRPSPTATTVVLQGCGHGLGCPQSSGPFRAVLASGRGGDQLSVDMTLPRGWTVHEVSGNGVKVGP